MMRCKMIKLIKKEKRKNDRNETGVEAGVEIDQTEKNTRNPKRKRKDTLTVETEKVERILEMKEETLLKGTGRENGERGSLIEESMIVKRKMVDKMNMTGTGSEEKERRREGREEMTKMIGIIKKKSFHKY